MSQGSPPLARVSLCSGGYFTFSAIADVFDEGLGDAKPSCWMVWSCGIGAVWLPKIKDSSEDRMCCGMVHYLGIWA